MPQVFWEVCRLQRAEGATRKPHNNRTYSSHLSRSRCLCGFWRSRSRVPCDDHRVSAGNTARRAVWHTPCSNHRHPTPGWCQRGIAEAGRDTGMDTCRPAVLPGGQTNHGENESPTSQVGREMKNKILLQAQTPHQEEGRPTSPSAGGPRCRGGAWTRKTQLFPISNSSGAQGEKKKRCLWEAGPKQTGQAVAWSPRHSSGPTSLEAIK